MIKQLQYLYFKHFFEFYNFSLKQSKYTYVEIFVFIFISSPLNMLNFITFKQSIHLI